MTKMRGVDPFPKLWTRRTTIVVDGDSINLMSLPDLVQAKKTQRDKDWPMVRRLIEVNYFENRENPTREQILFWFLELRTPDLLIELAQSQGRIPAHLHRTRPLLELALAGSSASLADALLAEEQRERETDRRYWAPLKKELESLRHSQASQAKG
jgi:hypothetical protein